MGGYNSSDLFPPARLQILKVLHVPQMSPKAEDQTFKYVSLWQRVLSQTTADTYGKPSKCPLLD